MSIAVGSFVLDDVAARADDTGSSEELGVRGLVYGVVPDWLDEDTGEVCDLLLVATSHHAQLAHVDLPASKVARSFRASRTDANRYVTLCARRVAKDKSKTKQWVFDLQAVAVSVLRDAPAVRDVPSPFPTDAELAAHDAATDGAGLLRRMQDSTDAHRHRTKAS